MGTKIKTGDLVSVHDWIGRRKVYAVRGDFAWVSTGGPDGAIQPVSRLRLSSEIVVGDRVSFSNETTRITLTGTVVALSDGYAWIKSSPSLFTVLLKEVVLIEPAE